MPKKGYKWPEERRKKFSGRNHPNWGRKHTSKWFEAERKRKTGKNNPNWKGGGSLKWRRKCYAGYFSNRLKKIIRKRENYTCQHCHLYEPLKGFMETAHIKSPMSNRVLAFDPNNALLLCPNCHKYFDLKNKIK